jgi:hypothetical protein
LDNIFQRANQYILIFQHDFSRESDAKLTDKIKMKPIISLLCLADALLCKKQILKEFWGIDEDGIGKFRLVMNQSSQSRAMLNKLEVYP